MRRFVMWDWKTERPMETEREFVPARADIAQLSALADLHKISILSYNVLSQMGARRLLRHENGAVDETLLRITRRRELLLEYVASELVGIVTPHQLTRDDGLGI